ncbi:MAG: 50S ribosomal protein L1 [Chloroflexi bacterium]|nr:50S ribosomal protein L1 [Chloroflexota bacterium]|tara:strand:+ start:2770 stop:3477 length:708 start_codon:yes stop_codon:yes gene_type:complete
MVKHGKRYNNILEKIDVTKLYSLEEGVALAKSTSSASFDETVELHLKTSADSRQADQLIRGVVILPHGVGKTVKVAAFVQGEGVSIAEESGADYVGSDDLVKKVESGWSDFDVAIATPDMMSQIGKLGKVLGRKGLMPNPRTGTVVKTDDIARAINDSKKGRVEYKLDKTSIMHISVGKVSFTEEQLIDNIKTLMYDIIKSKPSGIKGQFLKTAFLTTTMGVGIPLEVSTIINTE